MNTLHNLKRNSFGKIAKKYDFYRPEYPLKLIKDVILNSNIHKRDNILELGSGTGKATAPFAKRGFNITALDINYSLIKLAKIKLKNFINIKYINNSFEKIKLSNTGYDLVFSGEAFHWLDKKMRYQKTYKLLKPAGFLAIFSYTQSIETLFEKNIIELYKKYCAGFPKDYNVGHVFIDEIKKNKLFKNINEKIYFQKQKFTTSDYLKLQSTFSWVSILKGNDKKKFFSALKKELKDNKNVIVKWKFSLIITKKA